MKKLEIVVFALFCLTISNVALAMEEPGENDEAAAEEKADSNPQNFELKFVKVLSQKLSNTPYPLTTEKWNKGHSAEVWQEFLYITLAGLDAEMNPNIVLTPRFYCPVTLLTLAVCLAHEGKDSRLLNKLIEKKADFTFMSGDKHNQESVLIKANIKHDDESSLKFVQLMLDNGADPRQIGASGTSPIHFFAKFKDCSIEILRLSLEHLRKKNIDTNIRAQNGFTPLMTIADQSNSSPDYDWPVVKAKLDLLLEYGADLLLLDNEGRDLQKIIDQGRSIYPETKTISDQMRDWVSEKTAQHRE